MKVYKVNIGTPGSPSYLASRMQRDEMATIFTKQEKDSIKKNFKKKQCKSPWKLKLY